MGASLGSVFMDAAYRGWQGIAVENDQMYVFTDRNENFELENIISVYSLSGQKISELRAAYEGKDRSDKFMSFGDGNVIDGKLYVTAYNFNGGGHPYESKVLIYNLPELDIEEERELPGGVAESVTKHGGHFWVVYHDKMEVYQLDLDFNLVKKHKMSESISSYGGYQGSFWSGEYFFAQMHGANTLKATPSKGLDKYKYVGDRFIFLETLDPLSYGSGQGVCLTDDVIYQNDRPYNIIVMKRWDKRNHRFILRH
jgi:hypothetical protein